MLQPASHCCSTLVVSYYLTILWHRGPELASWIVSTCSSLVSMAYLVDGDMVAPEANCFRWQCCRWLHMVRGQGTTCLPCWRRQHIMVAAMPLHSMPALT